jgi:DNA-binding transcriptional LysR family regulator
MLSEFAARQFLKDGKLALVFGKFEVENLGVYAVYAVYAVYLSRNRMPPALRALMGFLARELQRPLSGVARARPNQRAKG